jgi:hypothetical protein
LAGSLTRVWNLKIKLARAAHRTAALAWRTLSTKPTLCVQFQVSDTCHLVRVCSLATNAVQAAFRMCEMMESCHTNCRDTVRRMNFTCALLSVCQNSCATNHGVGLPSKLVVTIAAMMHGMVTKPHLSVRPESLPAMDWQASAAVLKVCWLLKNCNVELIISSLFAPHSVEVRVQLTLHLDREGHARCAQLRGNQAS